MKKIPVILTIALIISIVASNAFALEYEVDTQRNSVIEQDEPDTPEIRTFKKSDEREQFEKDPLNWLEKKKESVIKEYNEGKLAKEKAEEIIQKIDKHIAEIKDFNSLSIEKKKEFLLSKAKDRIESMVKEGKITQQEAEKLLSEYTKKLEKWDGTGYPRLKKNCCKQKE